MPKIKVVIAEDHDVVRQGLKVLIKTDPELEVAGEAADGQRAIEVSQAVKADVVVMDLAMPRLNGLDATREIVRLIPNSKVLVLSSYGDDESVNSLMDAGAMGYITKHSASDDLLKAIRQVSGGKKYLSPRIAERWRRKQRTAFLSGARQAGAARLSPRECEVLKLIGQGHASKQIASELRLSVKTVEKHRQAVMNKLDIHEIAGLTRYAADKGLLRIEPFRGAGEAAPS
jgi:DNA-binding NarL/FixJ family response regulator